MPKKELYFIKILIMDFTPYIWLVIVGIFLFFMLREFWAWYWKTNQLLKNQTIQSELLALLIKQKYPELEKEVNKIISTEKKED